MFGKHFPTYLGTFGGAIASAVPSINAGDFLLSGLLAVFGATISFIVSLILKTYVKKSLKRWVKHGCKSKRKNKGH